jgi:LysM repeat protein
MSKITLSRGIVLIFVAILALSVLAVQPPSYSAFGQDDDCVNEYMIREGDTLSQIAKSNNVAMDELADVNDIENPRVIFIGNTLCLDGLVVAQPNPEDGGTGGPTGDPSDPSDGQTGGQTPSVPPVPVRVLAEGNPNFSITVEGQAYTTDANSFYTVRQSDRLYRIALAFGHSPEQLAGINRLGNPAIILVGQRLYVPMPTPSRPVPSSLPAISLIPRLAGPGDTVTVRGYNYPAEREVDIYLEKPSLNRKSDVIDTVMTDETGRFEYELTVPATWPDGFSVDQRTVSVSGYVSDNPSFWGMHFFQNTAFLK